MYGFTFKIFPGSARTKNQYNLIDGVYCRKVAKFSDARKPCCNQPKIQTKLPNLRVFHSKNANGKANSEDLDQTAPLGLV